MKRIPRLLALLPVLASLLHADWKIVTRTGNRTVIELYKGALMRTDSPPAYTSVSDFEHRRQVTWRSDLRQYMEVEWPPNPPQDSSSRPLILVQRNTTDTGERKQLFGRTARHLVTRTTRSDGPESTIDGWYVDAPGLPKSRRAAAGSVAVLTTSPAGQTPVTPRIQLTQTGPAPEGLAVWQKITTSMTLPGAAPRTFDTVSEVIDLVEAPLPDRLFHPPAGYRLVSKF